MLWVMGVEQKKQFKLNCDFRLHHPRKIEDSVD